MRARRPVSTVFGLGLAVGVPVLFLLVFFLVPLLGMLWIGLAPSGQVDLVGFVDVLGRPRTHRIIGLTLAQAATATVIALLAGLPVAAVLHRRRFRGAGVLRALVFVPFVLPTVVVGVAFRTLFRPSGWLGWLGLDGTFAAIIAALVFFNIAVVVRTVGVRWESLDPRQDEAAASLGASPWRVWWTVTLPALAPAVWSAAAVVFLFCATAFGTVLVLGGLQFGTIETEIYTLTMDYLDLPAAAALSLLQLVLVVALLTVSARLRQRGERGVTTRAAAPKPRLGRGDAGLLAWSLLVVAALMLPLAALVVRSLETPHGWGLDYYVAFLGGSSAASAVLLSLSTAAQAAAIALVLGLGLALALSRPAVTARQLRWRDRLDRLVMLPLGVSAVTVGLGMLITLNRPPLDMRTTGILIPISQAIVALPLVLRVLLPVLRGIDPKLREAAASLGASPARVLLDVDLRLAARPIAAATVFALAVSLGEFGATSFLARPTDPTLPVLIYRLITRPGAENLGMALAGSVILAMLVLALTGLVERLRAGVAGAF